VGLLPRDAQRVVTSAQLDSAVERFIEAQVRRPLTVPARAADPDAAPPSAVAGQIGYVVVAESQKLDVLARLLDGGEGQALVRARTAARAEYVHGELSRRGVASGDSAPIRVISFAAGAAEADRVVSYDVPFDADELRRVHAAGGTVLVTPAELPHLKRAAAEVPFTLKHRRMRELEQATLDAYRALISAALEEEDLHAQLLVLEPLFAEHSPVEVAAGLSALLRRRAPTPAPAAAGSAGAPTGAVPKEAASAGFTRLFISIGSRDTIRPGDLVGAITGEAGIKGDQVGRIDIRDTFSVVEVAAAAADRVIRALNGTTMRGRSLRVDYDRKTAGGPRSGGGPAPRSGGPGPRSGPSAPRRRPPPR
jgi:ATP-dependent RNA helicase DeaD